MLSTDFLFHQRQDKILTYYFQDCSVGEFGPKVVYYSTAVASIKSALSSYFKSVVKTVKFLIDYVILLEPESKRRSH